MSTFILSLNILHKNQLIHFKILLFAFQAIKVRTYSFFEIVRHI